jgi:pimeloyl-ACP methyl ester carboxylesterase
MKSIVLYTLGAILLIAILVTIALYIVSPGKPLPLYDADGNAIDGGISEIVKVEIGGVSQYLIIRGYDITKPVMLFLHGGPGSPEIAFMNYYNRDLEKDFVMVYWEQRGSGKSFSSDIPAESMTIEQFIEDTREVSLYLSERFSQPKIYLLGHSWGSLLGTLTIFHHPERFHAFFSVGQQADQYKSEFLSLEWIKEQARERNETRDLKRISAITFPDSTANSKDWLSFVMQERQYVIKYGGGTSREITTMWPLIKMLFATREYTLADKFNYMRGSLFSLNSLWLEVMNTNLFHRVDSVEVPVYIFHGIHDYTTSWVVAREFFEHLQAPVKEFYTFENSAHSPLMEEPERFNALVRQIVQGQHPD